MTGGDQVDRASDATMTSEVRILDSLIALTLNGSLRSPDLLPSRTLRGANFQNNNCQPSSPPPVISPEAYWAHLVHDICIKRIIKNALLQ